MRIGQSNGIITQIKRYILKRLEAPAEHYEQRIVNNLESLYKKIQPGDVLLVEGRSKLSKIIRLLTQSSWSHVAFYVGDNLLISKRSAVTEVPDGTDRQHMLIEAQTGEGVKAVPLLNYRNHNIRICRPFGISSEDLNTVVRDVISNIGNHYDNQNIADLALLLLPSFLNPFKKRTIKACLGGCSTYKVICSGMIARAFQKVGYPIVPALQKENHRESETPGNPYGSKLIMRHFSQITPRDFDLSPNFEIIKYNIVGMNLFDYKEIWADEKSG